MKYFWGLELHKKMIFLQLFFLRHHLIEKFTRNLFKWHLDTRFTPIHHRDGRSFFQGIVRKKIVN